MKKLLLLAALVAAPLAAPVAAHADPAKALKLQISTAGLDLRNPEDAVALLGRIEAAVRPVCVAPGFANGRSTAGCIRDMTRDAVRNLRIPELTFALQRRSSPSNPVAQG